MQQSPEKLIERLRSLRLSGAEREALRRSLATAMREHRAPLEAIPSPWPQFFRTMHFQTAFLLGVIVISYGSTAALAAEGALPGDILYPVKTRVVEPLARLVAVRTSADEADFEAVLLERRLREAEALDDDETLDAPLREMVRSHVRAQSARAEETERRAGGELPPSAVRSATSADIVAATGSPARFEDDRRRSERDEDKRGRDDKRRPERAVRDVLKEHKRILEKLEIQVVEDDEEKDDADEGKKRKERKDRD